MNPQIALLHTHPLSAVIACTGAGSGCQSIIALEPGASNTILDGIFPYSNQALIEFLGETPQSFASEKTALMMAVKARRRGMALQIKAGKDPCNVVGLAITGVIATNVQKKGDHRVHAALATPKGNFAVHITFQKKNDGWSLLGRENESAFADIVGVNLLLFAADIEQIPMAIEGVMSEDVKTNDATCFLNPRQIPNCFDATLHDKFITFDGQFLPLDAFDPEKEILFPGSYGPLHYGHEHTAREVANLTGKRVVYMITATHPVKGQLDPEVIRERVRQFAWLAPVIVTSDLPLYIDKARRFPNAAFVIGMDTMERMLDHKFYSDGKSNVPSMLQEFQRLGTHFYVAPRMDEGGNVVSIHEVFGRHCVTMTYRELFTQLSCRADVSSSEVRARGVSQS